MTTTTTEAVFREVCPFSLLPSRTALAMDMMDVDSTRTVLPTRTSDHEMNCTATVWTHPPPRAAGAVYFVWTKCLPPPPDQTGSPVFGPQERVVRHSAEQIVNSAPGLPSLDALVPLMGRGEVGDVLSSSAATSRAGRWGPH